MTTKDLTFTKSREKAGKADFLKREPFSGALADAEQHAKFPTTLGKTYVHVHIAPNATPRVTFRLFRLVRFHAKPFSWICDRWSWAEIPK